MTKIFYSLILLCLLSACSPLIIKDIQRTADDVIEEVASEEMIDRK